MRKLKRTMYIVIGILLALVVILWAGLQVQPAPFAPFPAPGARDVLTQPLPDDLPAPVARYYRAILGTGDLQTDDLETDDLQTDETGTPQIPVIHSAVISGRGRLRIAGITFPARFRFTHRAGHDYRHYIEATWFGLPIMRVNERYLNGQSRLELPVGTVENSPEVNQGANLGLWAESIWLPSVFLTDPRVRWEPIDAHTAVLVVPFATPENPTGGERFVARFDPATGLLVLLESMRFKNAGDTTKVLWLNQVLSWEPFGHWRAPARASLTWLDEGTPWANLQTEEIVYNLESADNADSQAFDLTTYLQQRGP